MAKRNERWARVCFLINFPQRRGRSLGSFEVDEQSVFNFPARGGFYFLFLHVSRVTDPLLNFANCAPTLTRRSSCILHELAAQRIPKNLRNSIPPFSFRPAKGFPPSTAREQLRITEFASHFLANQLSDKL